MARRYFNHRVVKFMVDRWPPEAILELICMLVTYLYRKGLK